MNRFVKHFTSLVLLLISTVILAQKNDAIIQTSQVQQAVARGAIIWDVRDEKSYLDGHIPGAINIGDAGSV
jgi:thiosulfate/3-mercaptopyruvate sulfurtransferase